MLKNKNIHIITSSLESGVIDKSVIDIATILCDKNHSIILTVYSGKTGHPSRRDGMLFRFKLYADSSV